jgi:site-specific recombinase XerC
MPGFHAGHPPRNKGLRYPADPPTVEEIVALMRIAGDGVHGRRLRGLVVVLWRAGLRIDEALELREADLDRRRAQSLSVAAKEDDAARSGWTTGAAFPAWGSVALRIRSRFGVSGPVDFSARLS